MSTAHLSLVAPTTAVAAVATHPMEVARAALREAALMEGAPLRDALLRVANGLPERRAAQGWTA